jgi:hypothetical protein
MTRQAYPGRWVLALALAGLGLAGAVAYADRSGAGPAARAAPACSSCDARHQRLGAPRATRMEESE